MCDFPKTWTAPSIKTIECDVFPLDDVAFLNRFGIDIRTAAHHVIMAAILKSGMPERYYDKLMRPYLTGFWRKCDGMSSPIWVRDKSQPLFRAHDMDYYEGRDRLESDRETAYLTTYFDYNRFQSNLIYAGMRSPIAWRAYRRHAHKRRTIHGYGTLAYIPKLPDACCRL